MDSSSTQLQRTLGPVMIWGLGVGYVISAVGMGAMIYNHPTIALVYAAILGGGWMLFVLLVPRERR